ncbi:hypothetical protein C0Q70_06313, partial [Pomacea canaliculata]
MHLKFELKGDVAPNSDYMEYFHHSQLTSSTPRKCGSANSSSSSESSNRSVARKSTHFSDHTGRIKDLELELRRLLHVKGEQDRELRQLREKCQNLEGRLNNADVDHTLCLAHAATLEAETKEAKSQLKVLQMQLPVQMQQKHEKLVQSLRQEHEAKSKELRQELEAVKKSMTTHSRKMQKAQQEVDILQQMLQKSQEACSSCEQKLQALQEESSKTQQQMHSLQLERERLQQALAQQGDVCAVTEQRLQAALQARDQGEKQMEQAQQKCYDLQQQLQQMQENHSKLQEQLQEELHSTKENLAKLQQSGIISSVCPYCDDSISVEEESKNLKLAKKDLEVRGDLMFDAIRSLKEEAYSESDVMKQQLFEELAENALLKEHIEQLEHREHGKEKELEVLSHAKLDLEAAIKSLMVDLHAVQQREEGAQSQVLHFQTQVQQLQVTEQDLKMQLEQQVTLADQEQNKLKDKLKRATEERTQLVEKHCEELQSVKKALALDHQEMDAKMSELALRLDRSQNFNRQMKDELKKLKGQEDEFQSALSNSEELARKNGRIVLDMEGQLERMREAALEERSGFERIISEMSEKIQQLEETETLLKEQEDLCPLLSAIKENKMVDQGDDSPKDRLSQRQQDEAEVAKLMEE